MLAKGFRFSFMLYFQYSQTFVCLLGICYFIEIEGDFSDTTALTKVVRLTKYNEYINML